MKCNQAGIDLIKQFEGLRLTAYRDIGGIYTIGYGCTHNVMPTLVIDQAEADRRLKLDLLEVAAEVSKLLTNQITDNQFAALCCFAYNVGVGNLKSSTLLKRVNYGGKDEAADEFLRWNKVKGVVTPGLVRRRYAERALFLS